MRRYLALVLLALMWTWGAAAQTTFSAAADGSTFNANGETSDAIDWQSRFGSTFSVNVLATGSPTTCTWNLLCTSKQGRQAVDAEYNSLGEVSGSPSDLSCLVASPQRSTVFVDKPYASCKLRLVTIGGGTTPAVAFHVTPGGTK